jgi:hypothetical protein
MSNYAFLAVIRDKNFNAVHYFQYARSLRSNHASMHTVVMDNYSSAVFACNKCRKIWNFAANVPFYHYRQFSQKNIGNDNKIY